MTNHPNRSKHRRILPAPVTYSVEQGCRVSICQYQTSKNARLKNTPFWDVFVEGPDGLTSTTSLHASEDAARHHALVVAAGLAALCAETQA